MEPNAVVRRELEGCEFFALILRPHQSDRSADVMYADDGNIERDVPFQELALVTDQSQISEASTEENLLRFRQCLEMLRAEEAELLREAASNGGGAVVLSPTKEVEPIVDDQGRIVCEDGTTILTHGEEQATLGQRGGGTSLSSCRPMLSPVRTGSTTTPPVSKMILPSPGKQHGSGAEAAELLCRSPPSTAPSSEDDRSSLGSSAQFADPEEPTTAANNGSCGSSSCDELDAAGWGSGSSSPVGQSRQACGGGLRGIRALRGSDDGLPMISARA